MPPGPFLSRTTLMTLLVLTLLPLLVFALWPQLNALTVKDASKPPDEDLFFPRDTSASAGNARPLLAKACAALEAGDIVRLHESDDLRDLFNQREWDAARAAGLIQQYETPLALFEEAARDSASFAAGVNGVPRELVSFPGARQLARLAGVHALHQFHEGGEQEGIEAALRIIELGHAVEGARGPLQTYTTGGEVKLAGLAAYLQMMAKTTLPREILEPHIARLEEFSANEAGLADSLRVEYQQAVELLYDIPQLENHLGDQGWTQGVFFALTKWSGAGKPNRTRERLAADYRRLIDQIPVLYRDVEPTTLRPQRSSFWEGYLEGNVPLEFVYPQLVPRLHNYLYLKASENTAVALARVLTAITCFENETGALPDSLDTLVPAYFDSIPRDGFVDQPIQYLRDAKTIYPIGVRLHQNQRSFERQLESRAVRVSFE